MISSIKPFLQSLRCFLSNRSYRKIFFSGLFDPFYYSYLYRDGRKLGMPPLVHYCIFGVKEGRRPNAFFDPEYYKGQIQTDCSSESLLFHYIDNGSAADIRPSAFFDPLFYQRRYRKKKSSNTCPLAHYLKFGFFQNEYGDERIEKLEKKPVISVIVPVYNVDAHYLNRCIASVFYQAYPHWELCLADDHSVKPHVRPLLEMWAARDPRIKLTFLDENRGIGGATNAAVSLATGDYLGFLDNDDELAADCLYEVAKSINRSGADLFYSDEDLFGEDEGNPFNIFAKPDFNPELLLNHNYVTHFVVVEKALYQQVGGIALDLNGAQDYDLFLRLSEQAKHIVHIPKILYHWRALETSTSINHQEKSYADDAGNRALVRTIARREIEGEILKTEWKYFYRIKRKIRVQSLVSVCIVYHDQGEILSWLRQLLNSIDYENIELILAGEVADVPKKQISEMLGGDGRLKVITASDYFGSMSFFYNQAAAVSTGEFLLFLSSEVDKLSRGWLEALLEYGQDPDCGMVGGLLQPETDNDAPIGIVPDLTNDSAHYYLRFFTECSRNANHIQSPQNVIALPAGICLLRRSYFEECNGFDEKSFWDVFYIADLCLRLLDCGRKNIYTPFVTGRIKLPFLTTGDEEKYIFQKHWSRVLHQGDPFYNRMILKEHKICMDAFHAWYTGDI